jgi:hypothetical protein
MVTAAIRQQAKEAVTQSMRPRATTVVRDAVHKAAAPKPRKVPPVDVPESELPSTPPPPKTRPASGRRQKRSTTAPATQTAKTSKRAPKLPAQLDEHGFVVGSDQSVAVQIMLAGGASRRDVTQQVQKRLSRRTTAAGKPKNASVIVYQLLQNLARRGYTEHGLWELRPPVAKSPNGQATKISKTTRAVAQKTTPARTSRQGRAA